jgi:hypothetical protein
LIEKSRIMAITRERIILDAENFRALVGGRRIALSSLGGLRVELQISPEVTWRTMAHALVEAIAGQERPIVDPPEAREFLSARRKR